MPVVQTSLQDVHIQYKKVEGMSVRTLIHPSQAVPTPWCMSMPMCVRSCPGGIGQVCSAWSAQLTWQLKWHTAQHSRDNSKQVEAAHPTYTVRVRNTYTCLTALRKMCTIHSVHSVSTLSNGRILPRNTSSLSTLQTPSDPPLQVIPCLTWPCMNEVQWSHFVGTSNERMTISWEAALALPCSSTTDRHTHTHM